MDNLYSLSGSIMMRITRMMISLQCIVDENDDNGGDDHHEDEDKGRVQKPQ